MRPHLGSRPIGWEPLYYVAHVLIFKACSLPTVLHAFEVVTEVATFFRSSTKRNGYLTAAINRLPDRTNSRWKLQVPCETRWASKDSAV